MEDYVMQQYFRQPGSYSVNGHVYEVDEKGNIKEWTPQGYKTPTQESVSKNLVNVGGRWIPANQVKIKRFSPLPGTSTKKPPKKPKQPQEEVKEEVKVTKSISPYATKEEQLKQAQEVIKEGLEQEREIIWLTGSYGIMPKYITETIEKRSDATWKRKEIKQGKKTTGEIYLVPGSGYTNVRLNKPKKAEIKINKSLLFQTMPKSYKIEKGPWKGEFTTTEELKRRGEYYIEKPFISIEGPVGWVASGFVGSFMPSGEIELYEKGKRVGAIRVGKSEELMTGTEKEYYKIGKGLGAAANIMLFMGKPIEPKHYELVGAETEYLGAAAKTTKGTKAEIGAWTKLKYAEYKWGEPTGFTKYELIPSYSELTTRQITKKLTKTIGEVSFKPPGSEEVLKTEVVGYSVETPFGAPKVKITSEGIKKTPGRLYYEVSKPSTSAKELKEGTRTFYEGGSFSLIEGAKGEFDIGWGRIKKVKGIEAIKEVKYKSAGVIRKVELPEQFGFKPAKTTTKTTTKVDTSLITSQIVKEAPVELTISSKSHVGILGVAGASTKIKTKPIQLPKFKTEVKSKSSIRNKGVSSVKPVFGGIFKEETKKKTIISPIQTELFKQKERKKIVQMPTTRSLFKQEVKQKKATSLLSKLLEKTGEKTSGRTAAKPPTPTPFGFGGFGFGFNIPRIKIPSLGGGFSLFKRKPKVKSKTAKKSYAPDIFSVFVGRKKKGKPKKKIYTGFEFRPVYLGNTKKR